MDYRKAAAGAAGAALVAGGFFYASKIEPQNVEVESISLVLPRLDEEFDGYRIVQISDIHMDGWMTQGRLSGLMKLVNEQRPDLVAVTGDFVTAEAGRVDRKLVDALSLLEAPDGAVAVLGNHDYIADENLVRRIIRDGGLTELSNDLVTLRRGRARCT